MHEHKGTSSFIRFKEWMTVVLTVFANGQMAPLTIIGKFKKHWSFPRHLNKVKDLGLLYYTLENAWNAQSIWNTIVGGFNKMAHLQGRKVKYLLDNC